MEATGTVLSLPCEGHETIEACVESHFSEQVVDSDHACGHRQAQDTKLIEAPQNLILHLQRINRGCQKIIHQVVLG